MQGFQPSQGFRGADRPATLCGWNEACTTGMQLSASGGHALRGNSTNASGFGLAGTGTGATGGCVYGQATPEHVNLQPVNL